MNTSELKKILIGKTVIAVAAYDTTYCETIGTLSKPETVIEAIELSDGTKLYLDNNYYQTWITKEPNNGRSKPYKFEKE